MKGKVVKVLLGILSLLVFIACIKIVVVSGEWWKELLSCIGIIISVLVNQYIFINIYQSKGEKSYRKKIAKADQLVLQAEYNSAKDLLDIIDDKYNVNLVKKDIIRLRNSINYILEKQSEIDRILQEAEMLAEKNDLKGCKNTLNKNILWFEGYEIIFNEFLSEEQKSKGLDLLRKCIII